MIVLYINGSKQNVLTYPGAYGIENCALPNSGGAMGATTSFPFNSSFTNGASVYLLQGMDKVSYLYRSKCSRDDIYIGLYISIYLRIPRSRYTWTVRSGPTLWPLALALIRHDSTMKHVWWFLTWRGGRPASSASILLNHQSLIQ